MVAQILKCDSLQHVDLLPFVQPNRFRKRRVEPIVKPLGRGVVFKLLVNPLTVESHRAEYVQDLEEVGSVLEAMEGGINLSCSYGQKTAYYATY